MVPVERLLSPPTKPSLCCRHIQHKMNEWERGWKPDQMWVSSNGNPCNNLKITHSMCRNIWKSSMRQYTMDMILQGMCWKAVEPVHNLNGSKEHRPSSFSLNKLWVNELIVTPDFGVSLSGLNLWWNDLRQETHHADNQWIKAFLFLNLIRMQVRCNC